MLTLRPPNYNGQVFVFFVITVAAAEVAGLAIIVALFAPSRLSMSRISTA